MLRQLFAVAVVLVCAGCSTENDISVGGAAESCAPSTPCSGSCVEGVCRALCDANFQCPGEETCVAVADAAVCLPPGAESYPPYAPLDLLTDCAGADGCELALDALELDGTFRWCKPAVALGYAELASSSFDYATACSTLGTYEELQLKERRVVRVNEEGTCYASAAGRDTAGALIEYCASSQPEQRVELQINRLVTQGAELYLWRGGASPFVGSPPEGGEWALELLKFVPETLFGLPANCQVSDPNCALPAFPRIGPAATSYSGLWVECDGQMAADCATTWSEPPLNGRRQVLFIREDGFGESFGYPGDPTAVQPGTCSAAFRLAASNQVVTLGHHDLPTGKLSAERQEWEIIDCETPESGDARNFCGHTTEGQFLFASSGGTEAGASRVLQKVALPAGFVDPCESNLPSFRF